MVLIRTAWLAALFVMLPMSARADVTVLVGVMSVGGPRPAVGWAFSYCPSVVGFEIEYFGTPGGATTDHSSAGGIFASLIVQPATTSNLQFFAIAGFGIFDHGGGVYNATNVGGGVKIRIVGPLRLRLDYRLFVLGDLQDGDRGPTTKYPQRFSAGLQLVF
jgi:hypothetical protein